MRALTLALFGCLSGAACMTAAGQSWVNGECDAPEGLEHRGWVTSARTNTSTPEENRSMTVAATATPNAAPATTAEPVEELVLQGGSKGLDFRSGERFRNTYYDFPREDTGAKDTALYDATCKLITNVTREFHDRVCVQGSGRLSTGETVSFAKRNCDCAETCPRTDQKICFERLDPARFPTGRGALGKAITPLRSIAVDSSVIPLGTVVFIPEYKGLELPSGGKHDGCFIAEDRGLKVVGRQIDIFTGDPSITTHVNAKVPSNKGVRVYPNDPRCRNL
jgi:3D (Asp-Asp-Asp) domain-containing protein